MKERCAWGFRKMEVATYAANIAPPVFSPSVEGAKRDNLARQTIPEPVQSQNSAASGQAGSQATSGTNSTLYAQSQVVIQEDGRRRQQSGGKNSSKGNGGGSEAEGKSTAQTAQSQKIQAASRVSSGQGTVAETSAQSVAASYSGSAQSSQEEKEIRKSEAARPSFARYSAQAAKEGQDILASQAVSARYNGIVRSYSPGENLSVMI